MQKLKKKKTNKINSNTKVKKKLIANNKLNILPC